MILYVDVGIVDETSTSLLFSSDTIGSSLHKDHVNRTHSAGLSLSGHRTA